MISETPEPVREEKGLSANQLILMFLVAVAVCAVFFAAGFLVGYNERTAKNAPSTERVSASPSVIPPVVNPPPAESGQAKEETVTEGKPIPQSAEPLQTPPLVPSRSVEKPAETPAPGRGQAAAAPATRGQGYSIQVAAARTEADAQKVIMHLKATGFSAYVVSPRAGGAGDGLYRVEVGPYPTRGEAERVRDKLARSGFKKPFIKH